MGSNSPDPPNSPKFKGTVLKANGEEPPRRKDCSPALWSCLRDNNLADTPFGHGVRINMSDVSGYPRKARDMASPKGVLRYHERTGFRAIMAVVMGILARDATTEDFLSHMSSFACWIR